jgi:hypothetical protein
MNEHVFNRNLLALSAKNERLGSILSSARPDPCLSFETSRTGLPVPLYESKGRRIALHSLIDPEREGERLATAQPPEGFVVALGLGGAYQLRPYLLSPSTSGVLLIEYSAPLLRAILENLDLSELFVDPRVSILLDPKPADIALALLSAYIPPLAGDLRTLPLVPRTKLEPEAFALASDAVRAVLERISDDYSVQAFFGRIWFRNAIRNLFLAERPTIPMKPARRAVITAAGPSLEAGIDELLAERRRGAMVIATDTSLPALLDRGIRPDAVVSIDCQAISYYHFMKGIPEGIPLILDLASPNRLARLSPSVRFFSSGHPLCGFISSRWRRFPALDTSGGNVSHAAISLAEALGAERALLIGADFSYPDGKSYARGTYIYDYFGKAQERLDPLESRFSGFVFRTPSVLREEETGPDGRKWYRYVTKPLMAYREHLERFAADSTIVVSAFRGRGVEIRIPPREVGRRESRPIFAAGAANEPAAAFLERYAKLLRALPKATEPASRHLSSLDHEGRDLWTTLLPSAAAFQRLARQNGEGSPRRVPSAELLENTRAWALAEIALALDAR